MSARNKHRLCAYCGLVKKSTVDHIPPKLLLEKPLPPNLVTVPACEKCNSGFKSDDEYTRTVFGLDLRAASHLAVISNLPAILRSLERPRAREFANYLTRQTTPTSLLGWNGAPIVSMKPEQQRINNAGLHILRGLYYHQRGKPVPADAAVRVGSTSGLTFDHPHMQTFARVFNMFPERRDGAMGRAFSYATAFGDRGSVWMMLLYDYFFWMGTIDERPLSERELDPVKP